MTPATLATKLLLFAGIVLLGGFAASALVRYSPGFDSLPEDLDPRISAITLRALHERHSRDNPLPVFYARYLASAIRGDFGVSETLKQPVAELLRQRAPVTLRLIGLGTVGGWLFASLLAWLAVWPRRAAARAAALTITGFLLAVPPAVLALAFFFVEAPLALALALGLTPRLFGTLRVLLGDLSKSPALLAARARGAGPLVIAFRYILGSALRELLSLAGVALVTAFALAIPVEALCGIPGIGALQLQAGLSRDMPVLCAMGLLVTSLVAFIYMTGDALAERAAL